MSVLIDKKLQFELHQILMMGQHGL